MLLTAQLSLSPPKEQLSNLTHAIFKFFGWQVWVSLHMEVPAVQLYNGPVFHLAQDLRNRLISIALRTESKHRPLLSGSESHSQCHSKVELAIILLVLKHKGYVH